MLRVALTGGIGTGKTTVLGRWRELGVPTIEADSVAHRVMAAGTPAAAAIASRYGHAVLTPSGDVDRRLLASVVFADVTAREDLERIVHPAVYAAIDQWMAARADHNDVLAVAEIPLLFETGHHGDFDHVVVTACDEREQVKRIVARGGDETDARRRMAAQWPIAEKARRADTVIRTDGTLEETRDRAEAVWRALRLLAGASVERSGPV